MRNIFIALIFSLVNLVPAYAQESEVLINAVEYERIIVNWNPQSSQLARILAYECIDCEVKSFIVNKNTQLQDEQGQPLNIYKLADKVDWEGTILTKSDAPNIIFKIMLH